MSKRFSHHYFPAVFSINDWMTPAPQQTGMNHLRINEEMLTAIPLDNSVVMPTVAKA